MGGQELPPREALMPSEPSRGRPRRAWGREMGYTEELDRACVAVAGALQNVEENGAQGEVTPAGLSAALKGCKLSSGGEMRIPLRAGGKVK